MSMMLLKSKTGPVAAKPVSLCQTSKISNMDVAAKQPQLYTYVQHGLTRDLYSQHSFTLLNIYSRVTLSINGQTSAEYSHVTCDLLDITCDSFYFAILSCLTPMLIFLVNEF